MELQKQVSLLELPKKLNEENYYPGGDREIITTLNQILDYLAEREKKKA